MEQLVKQWQFPFRYQQQKFKYRKTALLSMPHPMKDTNVFFHNCRLGMTSCWQNLWDIEQ